MSLVTRFLNAVLKFSEPLPDVRDDSMRLQAQSIAVIALIVIFVFMPLSLITPILTSELSPISVILRILTVVAAAGIFVLARRAHVRTSADALTCIGYGILWCIAVFADNTYIGTLRTLDLFVIITLLSTVVMPIRRAMVWWMLSFPLLLALPLVRSEVPLRLIYGGTILFHMAAGGTAIIVVGLLRRSERVLRAAALTKESELNTLMNHLPDYVVRMDTQFRYVFANQASQALLERPVEKLVGQSPTEVVPHIQSETMQSAVEQWKKVVEETIRTGKVQRIEIRTGSRDRSLFWFDIICVPEFDARGKLVSVLVVARDTTERRENEEALKSSRALIKRIADTAPYMMYVFNTRKPAGEGMEFANRALEEFVGCAPGDGLKLDDKDLIARVHPDDQQKLKTYMMARIRRSDASSEMVEVRMQRHDETWRWVRFWLSLFDAPSPRIERVMGVIVDFTEEKQMQEALLASDLAQMQAKAEGELNELKTQMMIRVADQFRNPLAAIQSAGEMLERYYDRMSESQRSERFDQIKAQVSRLIQLLDDMSAVLRQNQPTDIESIETTHLYALCGDMLDEMKERYGYVHRVKLQCDPDAQALIDPKSIRVILGHLLSNAFLYTPAGGEITLDVRISHDEIVLRLHDTGIGITDEDGARIFDPFYRGSNIDERPGLGLGLSIVRGEVLARHGSLEVISSTEMGSTFTVRLPNQRFSGSKTSGV